MMEITNKVTLLQINKLGDFVYTESYNNFDADLPYLGPYELENNAYYYGQWKRGFREGRGKQIWVDGSMYEGNWKDGMANGKGRLIHVDGDVYTGHWVDDRAHGEGFFTLNIILFIN